MRDAAVAESGEWQISDKKRRTLYLHK